jgi:hypothetical protein
VVNSDLYRARDKVEKRRVAGPVRLRLQRLWLRLYKPLVRTLKSRRSYREPRYLNRHPLWNRNRPVVRMARLALLAGAVAFVLWVIRALTVVISGNSQLPPFDVDSACRNMSVSCGALAATFGLFLPVGLASLAFLYRFQSVHRPFMRRARALPHELVQTAGSLIGEVVGRDELCQLTLQSLRDPYVRRPHLVIGGVATGKTALLVRLTKLLAERGAVPIPVRLQDAQELLDFYELARRRFLALAEYALESDAEGEKIWRQLLRNDRIVVLADGLEEALTEGEAERDRDNLIRLAIYRANDQGLPLVIASRPHDALGQRGLEATVVELEPLSLEAALQLFQRTELTQDKDRLDWIVETADVVETPLYLQVAHQLYQAGLMDNVLPSWKPGQLDVTHGVDRAELQLRLLDTWMEAVARGDFRAELGLSREDRQATLEQLSALACIGLKQDRSFVRFDDLEGSARSGSFLGSPEWPYPRLHEEVERRLEDLGRRFDIKLAAMWGTHLGLAQVFGDGARFPHRIIQAYLGSRLIHVAMTDERYRNEALNNPGRELLIALVMHSRAKVRQARLNGATGTRVVMAGPDGTQRSLQDVLVETAGRREDVRALDLYAAALEIDSVDNAPAHTGIAEQLREHWPSIWARDERTLEEAKLHLVRRFGEAARAIAERRRRNEPDFTAEPAYLELYRISACEPSYPIRLAAAQEIGAGGDEAFVTLQDILGPQYQPQPPDGQAARDADGNAKGKAGREASADPDVPEDGPEQEEREWREKVTRAWLAPLLVGSVISGGAQEAARRNLERWLQGVATADGWSGESGLHLSLEVALAQGFKHAANRRRRHPHAHPEAQAYLAEQAREMLRGTGFWFSRLTLLHALCLWSLPDGTDGRPSTRGRGADPKTLVEYWAAVPDATLEHPFVAEARKLAMWALETGQPERFIWIDESRVLARVGSRTALSGSPREHNLWIPPSAGWTALDPRAQQLVADVFLLLNLADRGNRPSDRHRRLQRTDRNHLALCLGGERHPLDPARTVVMPAETGSNCQPGCPFELCPYPPKGESYYRVELSEAFCRRQRVLMSQRGGWRRTAPWQGGRPRALAQFWKQMEQRSQPS